MSKKKLEKRSGVKPFVKYVNYTHIMPTRYSVPAEMNTKDLVSETQMDSTDGKVEARKAIAGILKEKFLNPAKETGSGKSALLFLKKKLRF